MLKNIMEINHKLDKMEQRFEAKYTEAGTAVNLLMQGLKKNTADLVVVIQNAHIVANNIKLFDANMVTLNTNQKTLLADFTENVKHIDESLHSYANSIALEAKNGEKEYAAKMAGKRKLVFGGRGAEEAGPSLLPRQDVLSLGVAPCGSRVGGEPDDADLEVLRAAHSAEKAAAEETLCLLDKVWAKLELSRAEPSTNRVGQVLSGGRVLALDGGEELWELRPIIGRRPCLFEPLRVAVNPVALEGGGPADPDDVATYYADACTLSLRLRRVAFTGTSFPFFFGRRLEENLPSFLIGAQILLGILSSQCDSQFASEFLHFWKMSGQLDRFSKPCVERVSGHDEGKERKTDLENSEDDRKTKMGSLRKRALSASSKLRNSLLRRSGKKKNGSRALGSIADVREVGEIQAVDSFRQSLIADELLPAKLDDYHIMLRWCIIISFKSIILFLGLMKYSVDNAIFFL
ncbi:hypothetical protein KSP39_PZI015816 [Platanthera zijinensis]|uniref:Uncharacterized protein n=1 Tax=Platanthera zijinensis TaxID=2320716 RepID=A0AAP0G1Y8_9ASPA